MVSVTNTIVRYLFAIAIVATTFALRIWLIPFTGTGAPYVLFFAAVLVTSLFAGVGPGICALLMSMPLAAYTFVTRAGYPPLQAAFQALLFGIDGIVVIYLAYLIKKGRQEITRSMARIREVIELSPDAFFQSDLEARFTDVNQAACRLLGYDRDELIGKTIFDIIPVEDAARLKTVRDDLLVPGQVDRSEWVQKRKDGTFVPVEVSSNILPEGRWQAFVRDITERKRFAKEQQLLAEAGAVLAASLDYDQTLATVAQLVVRDFADWCMVEVVDEHEQIRRVKVVAGDPSRNDVCAFLEHVPIDRDRPYLLRATFETKQSFLITHVTSDQLESFAQGPEHLQALRGMSPKSLMGVPLLRQGRLLGVLAFISATGSRQYGRSDLRLAEALADRAAIAIENARLYRASVHATQLRDQVLGVVAHDLRSPLSNIPMQISVREPHWQRDQIHGGRRSYHCGRGIKRK